LKVREIVLPKLTEYYISKRVMDLVVNNLNNADMRINDGKIHTFSERDIEVEQSMLLIRKKSEKITAGNRFMYEYELDISIRNGHEFIIRSDENGEYRCTLLFVCHSDNNRLHCAFSILKK